MGKSMDVAIIRNAVDISKRVWSEYDKPAKSGKAYRFLRPEAHRKDQAADLESRHLVPEFILLIIFEDKPLISH